MRQPLRRRLIAAVRETSRPAEFEKRVVATRGETAPYCERRRSMDLIRMRDMGGADQPVLRTDGWGRFMMSWSHPKEQ